MSRRKTGWTGLDRRAVLKGATAGAAFLAAPAILRNSQRAHAQGMDASAFEAADIDWRQADGAAITIGVIPAGYFNNL